MKKKIGAFLMLLTTLFGLIFTNYNTALAEDNIIPDYEVKLLLDSDVVLNSDNSSNVDAV
ncbi:MAG: hypothetical protein ACERKZ_12690 [Lachnotalea sp.]